MDNGVGTIMRKVSLTVVVVAALILAVGMPGQASALTCTAVGGVDNAGDCTISTPITAFCPFVLTVTGDLLITGTGSISCNDPISPGDPGASDITITVGGDMEMQAGSAILAENNHGGGNGGKITLTVAGDFTMRGPSPTKPGAVISSRDTGSATGVAGDIRIKVGNSTVNPDDLTVTCAGTPSGDILIENGAQILADALGEAGSIKMFAGKDATINGLVSSVGTSTSGRGGPITIDACCNLVIGDTGKVISQGQDPGADLVHLQACIVKIFGLVASTGPGHQLAPANLCNVNRPGKPANSSACVEVWAGTTLLIDSTNGHKGEVNADTAQAGGINGRSWIDLLANLAITIHGNETVPAAGNNDTSPAFAVHANQFLGNGHGGDITVISTGSTVTMLGRALQANSSTNVQSSGGGSGGHIVILAHDAVAFGTGVVPAFVQAAGDPDGAGGTILAQSFNGNVTGVAASVLNADGPGGTVTLRGCADPGGPGGTYLGTVIGAYTHTAICPGGSPPLPSPANTLIPSASFCTSNSCGQAPAGNKTGVKFLDSNQNGKQDGEPGIIGWTINVFDRVTKALVASTTTIAANPLAIPATPDGFYTFTLSAGDYTVCEVLPTGWTQTAPNGAVPIPAGETQADCSTYTNGGTPGPRGYNFTIPVGGGVVHANNDFGNFQPGVCPQDPLRASKITRVVDATNTSHGPAPVYLTLQAAYNAAVGPNEVIGLFSPTTENVVLGGAKTLTITQCTLAGITAAQSGVVMDITSTGKLTIIGPDTHGGTIGWRVGGGPHTLKSIRANGASQFGVQVLSSSNIVNWNSLNGNAVGLRVEVGSNSNTLSGSSVSSNTGDGVQIAGNNNSLTGAKIESNTGNGVFISGTGNTIKSNKANKNTLAGFKTDVTATGSKFGSNASNETSQNGTKENGGPEYDFAAGSAPVADLFNNKADNVAIPTATKCPTLFSLGGTCE
jgi:hypothetical protein